MVGFQVSSVFFVKIFGYYLHFLLITFEEKVALQKNVC